MATTYDPTTADPGQIEKIPAGSLVIDPNVRTAVRLDKSFVSSIRVLGFQQHPVGYRDGDQVHITVGQRRISAALEIGWPVVPVVIKPRRAAEQERTEELRLLEQMAENEQRLGLTPAEVAGGYKQLALLGVSEDQIARKTNAPKATVQTALAVAGSEAAVAALQAQPITLDQANFFVEFGDDPAAIEQLNEILAQRPEQLEHTASRLRRDRESAAAVEAKTNELELLGWTVKYSAREYGIEPPSGGAEIGSLYRADDKKKNRLDVDLASKYDGRVAVVFPRSYGDLAGVAYYIRNFAKQGLERYSYGSEKKGPLSDEEKERRRQKRTDRTEMTAATVVRREWIQTFINGKPKPVDVNPWIAHVFLETDAGMGFNGSDSKARDLAAEWLGVVAEKDQFGNDYQTRHNLEEHINEKPADAARVMLAYAIAQAESTAGDPKHPWFGDGVIFAAYFETLAAWGYTLADVEQRIVTKHLEVQRQRDEARAALKAKEQAA